MKRITKVKEAAYLAISLHGMQNYDGYPYYYHLEQVVDVLKEFGFSDDKYVIAGYLHDVMEDTAISYNDIKKQFGEEIAEIVYCVTDELGRNRKERKEKTYPKIASNPDAVIIKLADRIANMRNSIEKKHSMSDAYVKEFDDFESALYNDNSEQAVIDMWVELNNLIYILKYKPQSV
jgi:(p)ppGpp synthase/HD superfamily hydrolase